MKKLFAGLMAMVMLFTSMATADERLPYTYTPIKITLSNLDEDAFRQWAYEKLSTYQESYLRATPTAIYKEYYKLASYKDWYGSLFGKEVNTFGKTISSIAYTSETMTEEQLDQMYLLMMLNSLAEMKALDPSSMREYLTMSGSQRKYYTLQMDGTWAEDPYLESVAKQSDAKMAESLTNIVVDAIDLGVGIYTAYYSPGDDDIAESITKIATQLIKDLAKLIAENAKAKAENEIKRYLTELVAQTMLDAKLTDMACLKEVYLSGDYPNPRAVKVAQQLYDLYNSDACENALLAESEKEAERLIKEENLLEKFGMTLQEELEGSEILILTVMDAVKLALNEVLDNLQKNTKTQAGFSKGYENTIISILSNLIDQVCENIQENWIKTGSFDFSKGFEFETEDWNKILQEVNIFDFLTDSASLKNARESLSSVTVIEHVRQLDKDLPARIGYLLAYYMILELPEAALDDLINKKTASDYASTASKSLQKFALQFFKDCCSIVKDYMKDKAKVTASEQQAKLKELRKENKRAGKNVTAEKQKEVNAAATKTINELNDTAKAIDDISSLASLATKAWNVGEGIVTAYFDTANSLNGEDEISFLAEQTVTAKALSQPLQTRLLGMAAPHILDKEKMSTADVWEYVSAMNRMADHDATGANAYYNVSVKAANYKKSVFVKLLNGEGVFRYSLTSLNAGWITYDYVNIYGQRGLLPIGTALLIRETIVEWANWTNEGLDEKWLSMQAIWD